MSLPVKKSGCFSTKMSSTYSFLYFTLVKSHSSKQIFFFKYLAAFHALARKHQEQMNTGFICTHSISVMHNTEIHREVKGCVLVKPLVLITNASFLFREKAKGITFGNVDILKPKYLVKY